MSTPHVRTSSARLPEHTTTGGASGVIANFGKSRTLPVNFSGQATEAPSGFTLLGELRVFRSQGADVQTVFEVDGQFRVTLDRSGTIVAGFLPQGAGNTVSGSTVSGRGSLVDGGWSSLIVSFDQVRHDSGTLAVYVDSVPVAEGTVSTAGTPLDGGDCVIGKHADRIEFAQWTMWSGAYDPKSGLGDPPAVLVGSWNFADGPVAAVGGQVTPQVPNQVWHVPALAMTGDAYVVPNVKGLNPGAGPFTVMGWAYVPDPIPSVTYPLVSNFQSGVSRLQLHVAPNDSGALFVAYLYGTPGNQAWSYGQIHHRWTHVALTFDGSSTQLYTDGNRVGGPVAGKFPPIQTPTLSFGSDPDADRIWAGSAGSGATPGSRAPAGNTWYLQALSIWTRALGDAEIRAWMNPDEVPSHQPECAAFFPLVESMLDAVSRQPLSPVGNVAIVETVLPISAIDPPR